MRVLFSMRNFWYIKHYDPLIAELAERGHAVHILAEGGERNTLARDWTRAVENLSTRYPNVTFSWAPRDLDDNWVDLRLIVRHGLDYLRFLTPKYKDAPILEARAVGRTPRSMVRLAHMPLLRTGKGRRALYSALKLVETAVPTDRRLVGYIADQKPDLILVTPLVTLGSDQQEILRAARFLGIPCALCVGSWDHLSSKSLIRLHPDRVFVWNDIQRREATEMHGIADERVVVTGAQCFDEWFDREPSRSREEFCRHVGLPADRPLILYACSALFYGSPNEAEFVVRWIRALRNSADPRLREAGILVRPHPKRAYEWDGIDLREFRDVVLWPPLGAAPVDRPTKNDYFDSLYHSAAIVGLNTSAMIEGGIVGRPIHTVLLPEFFDNQEGTIHFHYLLKGGLLRCSRSLEEHAAQLAQSLSLDLSAGNPNKEFIERFVRPRGLRVAATPVFADAVEELGRLRVEQVRPPKWAGAVRMLLQPVAHATYGTFAEQIARQRRFRDKQIEAARRNAELHAQRQAEKARILAERQARHEAERKARLEAKLRAREQQLLLKEKEREAKRRDREKRWARKRRQGMKRKLAGLVRSVLGRAAGL